MPSRVVIGHQRPSVVITGESSDAISGHQLPPHFLQWPPKVVRHVWIELPQPIDERRCEHVPEEVAVDGNHQWPSWAIVGSLNADQRARVVVDVDVPSHWLELRIRREHRPLEDSLRWTPVMRQIERTRRRLGSDQGATSRRLAAD